MIGRQHGACTAGTAGGSQRSFPTCKHTAFWRDWHAGRKLAQCSIVVPGHHEGTEMIQIAEVIGGKNNEEEG